MEAIHTLQEEDARKFIVCGVHEGSSKVNFQTEQYVVKKRNIDGAAIINITKTWDKLYLAARIIASVDHYPDVCVVSNKSIAQRALLKFSAHTGSTPIVGRFTPGSLTNQSQKNFKEPRLLIVSDPLIDSQAILEASHVSIPVIALCNVDSPVKNVDVVIPCNNKSPHSIGLIYWMLAREVLHLRGGINKSKGFIISLHSGSSEIMPDLYFHREPQEIAVEEEEKRQIDESAVQQLAEITMDKSGTGWGDETGTGMEVGQPSTEERVVDTEPEVPAPQEEKLNIRMERIVDWAAASKPTENGWGNLEDEQKK